MHYVGINRELYLVKSIIITTQYSDLASYLKEFEDGNKYRTYMNVLLGVRQSWNYPK